MCSLFSFIAFDAEWFVMSYSSNTIVRCSGGTYARIEVRIDKQYGGVSVLVWWC